MRINNVNNQGKNTVFGYNLPQYCNYSRTILTEKFINEVCNKKRAQGQTVYERYIQALENFKNKRFDANELDKLYRPQIEKLSKGERFLYDSFIEDFQPPVCCDTQTKQVTREVKTPFRNFLNFIFGNPKRNKQITETVEEKGTPYRDLSRIDASLEGVKFTRYGSFFDGDNPPKDFYEIKVECGKQHPIVIERFKADSDSSLEKADKRLEAILSDADCLDKLTDKITQKLEERFKSYCENLKNDYKERLEANS